MTTLSCNTSDPSARVLECLLDEYIGFYEIEEGDTIVIRELTNWTDSLSLISIHKYGNGRSINGSPHLLQASFEGITILGMVSADEEPTSTAPKFSIANSLDWSDFGAKKNYDNGFTYPESFDELQMEFSSKAIGNKILGDPHFTTLNTGCTSEEQQY